MNPLPKNFWDKIAAHDAHAKDCLECQERTRSLKTYQDLVDGHIMIPTKLFSWGAAFIFAIALGIAIGAALF